VLDYKQRVMEQVLEQTEHRPIFAKFEENSFLEIALQPPPVLGLVS
jgi:hypothetical protein